MTAEPPGGFSVDHHRGRAEDLHHRRPAPGSGRAAWVMEVSRPAVVLGSTQDRASVHPERARRRGIDIVRRSSGGGAVLLVPGEHLWVDFWVPPADPLWDDDVIRGARWVGELWAETARRVLAGLPEVTQDCESDVDVDDNTNRPRDPQVHPLVDLVDVHAGGLLIRRHAAMVCFAGKGPGEVFVDGRKLVGVSQRRTRDWTRIQSLVHHRWDPATLVGTLDVDPEDPATMIGELADLVAVAARPALLEEFLAVLRG